MKTAIGVYETHDMALNAVAQLKDAGYHMKLISIMGLAETEEVDEELHLIPKNPVKIAGVAAGTIVGTTLGILTGVGLFAIPGVGFLFGAGAVVGAVAGFDFGLIGGGLISVFTTLGIHEEAAKKYHDDLVAGRYLLLVQGTHEEVEDGMAILTKHATHSSLNLHSSILKGSLGKLDSEFPLSGAESKL